MLADHRRGALARILSPSRQAPKWAALFTLLVTAAPFGGARAEAPPAVPSPKPVETQDKPADADRPWAANVSEAQQKEALSIFEDANKLFADSRHAEALGQYREALKVWDHPAIRYNAAVALINLDQPLAAHDELERALRYGAAPFAPNTYQQALTYRKLLAGQLAELEITCADEGAEVTLDGQSMFVGPGRGARWLLPGSHQLVARKAGFLPDTRSLTLMPGKRTQEKLAVQEIKSRPMKMVRRWSAWKPWAVTGGGVLLAALGIPLMLDAQRGIDTYDAAITECAMMAPNMGASGCPAAPMAATDAKNLADVEQIVAISLFAVGGAAVATGLALAVLNIPRAVPAEGQATIVPLAGRDQVGLSLVFRH